MSTTAIRKTAKVYALIAELEATRATIAGMEAENQIRIANGAQLAYGDEAFSEEADCLREIANRLERQGRWSI